MATEVRLPQWGMGMDEGTILRWLRAPGERVDAGDPVAEVEAAKVTDEVTSPVSGIVSRILVEEGETVPVGSVLLEVEEG